MKVAFIECASQWRVTGHSIYLGCSLCESQPGTGNWNMILLLNLLQISVYTLFYLYTGLLVCELAKELGLVWSCILVWASQPTVAIFHKGTGQPCIIF